MEFAPKPQGQENAKKMTRGQFIKILTAFGITAAIKPLDALAKLPSMEQHKTRFVPTNEKFKNGELVFELRNENGERIGEFWPIKIINLVTKKTDPEIFTDNIEDIQTKLRGVATAPDGMTSGSLGSYEMEGKSLSNGRECGDGQIKNYGIVTVIKNNHGTFDVNFTHKKEHEYDFDSLYNSVKQANGTLFFLPSIYRNGEYINSNNEVDKVLIRREVPVGPGTPKGEQLGVVLFDKMLSYDKAREAILGLDRPNASKTTHIYMLDGGKNWGQSIKEVNGIPTKMGTRNPEVVTNYLVFY